MTLNQPPNVIPTAATNVQKLIEANILSNSDGMLKYSLPDSQLLSIEIWLPYELESLFGSDFICEVAKEALLSVAKNVPHQDNRDWFLADLLTALGYGIVTVERGGSSEIFRFDGAPWCEAAEKSSFPLLRGILEGFLEGQGGTSIRASFKRMELNNNRLTVIIEVSEP